MIFFFFFFVCNFFLYIQKLFINLNQIYTTHWQESDPKHTHNTHTPACKYTVQWQKQQINIVIIRTKKKKKKLLNLLICWIGCSKFYAKNMLHTPSYIINEKKKKLSTKFVSCYYCLFVCFLFGHRIHHYYYYLKCCW